jgi:FkbM family methyltransferase
MQQKTDFLQDVLGPRSLTTIVDIGANPIDGDPPYKNMLGLGLCQVIGFEPQEDALQDLLVGKGPHETYLPYAVGDGEPHTLYRCAASGMTSLHKPDRDFLSVFNDFDGLGKVIGTERISTKRLDDISEISDMDMLKVDIQGGELAVFQSGRHKLGQAVAIQTEVSFMPLYENQPVFWEIDKELRAQGFIPHAFAAIKRWPIAPYSHPVNSRQAVNQLLEADVVYVKDFVGDASLSDEQVKQLALIMHHCYESHDLVSRCLSILSDRGVIPAAALDEYRRHIFPERGISGEFKIDDLPVSFYLR